MAIHALSRQYLLTLVLLATSTVTGVNAVLGANNYLQFYPALERLRLDLTEMQWVSNTFSLNGTVQFEVLNPADYKGMSLKIFHSSLEIVLNGSETIPQSMPGSGANGPLEPDISSNVTQDFQGTLDTPQRVTETIGRGGQVTFVFTILLVLSTFLDKAATTIITYQCESDRGPGICNRVSIVFLPTREFTTTSLGGGGGGGGV